MKVKINLVELVSRIVGETQERLPQYGRDGLVKLSVHTKSDGSFMPVRPDPGNVIIKGEFGIPDFIKDFLLKNLQISGGGVLPGTDGRSEYLELADKAGVQYGKLLSEYITVLEEEMRKGLNPQKP